MHSTCLIVPVLCLYQQSSPPYCLYHSTCPLLLPSTYFTCTLPLSEIYPNFNLLAALRSTCCCPLLISPAFDLYLKFTSYTLLTVPALCCTYPQVAEHRHNMKQLPKDEAPRMPHNITAAILHRVGGYIVLHPPPPQPSLQDSATKQQQQQQQQQEGVGVSCIVV